MLVLVVVLVACGGDGCLSWWWCWWPALRLGACPGGGVGGPRWGWVLALVAVLDFLSRCGYRMRALLPALVPCPGAGGGCLPRWRDGLLTPGALLVACGGAGCLFWAGLRFRWLRFVGRAVLLGAGSLWESLADMALGPTPAPPPTGLHDAGSSRTPWRSRSRSRSRSRLWRWRHRRRAFRMPGPPGCFGGRGRGRGRGSGARCRPACAVRVPPRSPGRPGAGADRLLHGAGPGRPPAEPSRPCRPACTTPDLRPCRAPAPGGSPGTGARRGHLRGFSRAAGRGKPPLPLRLPRGAWRHRLRRPYRARSP